MWGMERWWWEREDPTASRGGQATIFAVFLLSGCHSQAHGFFGLAVAEQGCCCMHAAPAVEARFSSPKAKPDKTDSRNQSKRSNRPTDLPLQAVAITFRGRWSDALIALILRRPRSLRRTHNRSNGAETSAGDSLLPTPITDRGHSGPKDARIGTALCREVGCTV